MNPEFIDGVRSILLSQDQAKPSANGKQIAFRCPFCNDSKSSRTITSFSVKIDVGPNESMPYQCFRSQCKKTGVVDQEFLERLGVKDHRLIMSVNAYNRKAKKHKRTVKFGDFEIKGLSNIIGNDTKLNEAKLGYLYKRLGHKFTLEEAFKYKIVLDYLQLLDFNEIDYDKKNLYKYKLYSLYGLGFLSMYNDFVIIRDIAEPRKLYERYINENVFGSYENVTKFYVIPTSIDILDPDPVVINVTEGIISLFGVYFNTNIDRDYKQQIYAAACGGGIMNLILHFIYKYALTNIKINIFSDSEIKKESYDQIKRLKQFVNDFDVTIYYNSKADDFGHKPEDINIISSKLK